MQPGKKSVSVIDQIFHKTFMYVGGGREGWARVRKERGGDLEALSIVTNFMHMLTIAT